MSHSPLAIHWVEQGLVPDKVVRAGIRRLLKERLVDASDGDVEPVAQLSHDFVAELRSAPRALLPERQRTALRAARRLLRAGARRHRKYSGCWWGEGVETLDQAEAAALAATCERAGLVDRQDVLELGCGWG